jgi:hypothetical protein
MNEMERRLRAAMHAAVDGLPPPADLLQQVRLRCISFDIWTSVRGRPEQITFPVGRMSCGRG